MDWIMREGRTGSIGKTLGGKEAAPGFYISFWVLLSTKGRHGLEIEMPTNFGQVFSASSVPSSEPSAASARSARLLLALIEPAVVTPWEEWS